MISGIPQIASCSFNNSVPDPRILTSGVTLHLKQQTNTRTSNALSTCSAAKNSRSNSSLFPGVFFAWVSFPMNQIGFSETFSILPHFLCEDGLNLILQRLSYQLRWLSVVVNSIWESYWDWKVQFISMRRNFSCDSERAQVSWYKFVIPGFGVEP